MIANPSTLGNYTPDNFFKTPIIANEYIPFFAFQTSSQGYYNKPSLETGIIRKPNTMKNIKDAFQMAIAPSRIAIGDKLYFFVKGVMFTDTGTPLMVFAMPREKFLNPDTKRFSDVRYQKEVNPVDYKDFVLFYSTSFFTDPSLAPLNRRFQKEILMSCYQKGIEVRVITSQEIERNTFADLFEIPKANSVSQLEEYMSKVLPTYLFTEEEDTFVFDELETVQAQNEELSVEEEALLFDSEETLTWDNSAHTESPYLVAVDEIPHPSIVYPDPQTAASFVERMRPLQDQYNMDMQAYMNLVVTGEAVMHADHAMAGALTTLATLEGEVTQVGNVTWRSSRRAGPRGEARDTRPIELIDDEE